MRHAALSRRRFLSSGLVLGCSAAAAPLWTHATFASAPTEQRLIVVILRGALDGLDVIRPAGDPALARLRPDIAAGEGPALTDFWQLHPSLSRLMPLWQAGELGFVQAVSTPYRDKRSHFDGQHLLEAGTAMDAPPALRREGWMNRLLQTMPGSAARTAFAVGRDALPVLAGAAEVQRWAPDADLRLGAQARRLLERIYEDDPPFHAAASAALDLSEMLDGIALAEPDDADAAEGMMMASPEQEAAMLQASVPPGAIAEVSEFARFAAARLREDTRIVALSLSGWDTHAGQVAALRRPMARLEELVLQLRAELGPLWSRTAFLAMTEFGRTVRQNGTAGTDHGTGGAMLTAGGAIRGGRVLGHWPGLAEEALYAGRDLQPTGDVRAVAGWVMHALLGVERQAIEGAVFPGLDLGVNPGIV